MAVCWVILRGKQINTVIQAVHSLLYIVAKCHFFSAVTWKEIIKYLQKCEGCTHFSEILYIYVCIISLVIEKKKHTFCVWRGVSATFTILKIRSKVLLHTIFNKLHAKIRLFEQMTYYHLDIVTLMFNDATMTVIKLWKSCKCYLNNVTRMKTDAFD